MFDLSVVQNGLVGSNGMDRQAMIAHWLSEKTSFVEKSGMIKAALESPVGPMLRAEVGKWIVDKYVPTEAVVPEEYAQWRMPVRDAMQFVVSRLSAGRLAPKILEQLELPPETTPEARLLRLISRVPGLQKLGQVLARNRHLRPSMRRALSELENGIHDVEPEDIYLVIEKQLGTKLDRYDVKVEATMLSEASVSAVVRFTWTNPESRQRERGVFKVLKPYVPLCFAEDMDFLRDLAKYFGARHKEYGFAKRALTDTFAKVQRLLRHEVRFLGEQRTLVEAQNLYQSMPGVRIPRLIRPLCTPSITAITEEPGIKITDAVRNMPEWKRGQVAQQLIEALVALPLFAPMQNALYHADPHAGNLLYDANTRELVIIDWALSERLSRQQRRHLALLVFMVGLRDEAGVTEQIRALSEPKVKRNSQQAKVIKQIVSVFFAEFPFAKLPGAVDAMRLLQSVAIEGIRFPSALIMMSKVLFTLDGILSDIGGSGISMALTIVRHPLNRWIIRGASTKFPLSLKDWVALQMSAMFYGGRLAIKLQESIIERAF